MAQALEPPRGARAKDPRSPGQSGISEGISSAAQLRLGGVSMNKQSSAENRDGERIQPSR
jgi:hypothetical protein